MRCVFVPLAMAVAAASSGARAELQTISFVHLATAEPQGGSSALYLFSFTTEGNSFKSGTVYFNLANGARYGCGVHAFASCTLRAAGQVLQLTGLSNGIQGTFSWYQDPVIDNRPTEISIGAPLTSVVIKTYDARISQPFDVPEPASWAMMTLGFGLAGSMARRVHRHTREPRVQRSWLSLLPRRLMPALTIDPSRTD